MTTWWLDPDGPLYRVGGRSPMWIVAARQRTAGKEVILFVELKARFDEARNIAWVCLKRRGCGRDGRLWRRRPQEITRRLVGSARGEMGCGDATYTSQRELQTRPRRGEYTDWLVSADHEFGADVNDLFNELNGSSHRRWVKYENRR